MVGLPARGKSYIGQKISRYLNWMGVLTKVFNVGQYRRTFFGANHTHEWFAPDNVESQKLRQHAAQSAADDMLACVPLAAPRRPCVQQPHTPPPSSLLRPLGGCAALARSRSTTRPTAPQIVAAGSARSAKQQALRYDTNARAWGRGAG